MLAAEAACSTEYTTMSVIFDLLGMLRYDGQYLHLSDQVLQSLSNIPAKAACTYPNEYMNGLVGSI